MNSTFLRMLRSSLAVAFATLVLAGASAAAPVISFTATPSAITGTPGTTIGWGYEITNSSGDFYVPTALNADLFQWALPLALFDFQVIAPGTTITQDFVADLAGLYQLTWDSVVPDSFVNEGVFVMSGDFYSDDPLAGGSLLSAAPDAVANYSATLQSVASVPEPGGLLLLLSGLVLMLVLTRKKLSLHSRT